MPAIKPNHRNYTPPRVFVWLASFVSAAGFVGALQPDFSSKLTAYRTGTARFEAVFSVKIANVTPITLPDGPKTRRGMLAGISEAPAAFDRESRRQPFAVAAVRELWCSGFAPVHRRARVA